ncbi:MAG: anti-sigma factor [Vicinamibacterales bacterium]
MTECRLIESALAPFVDDGLDADQAGRVARHLAACPACRAREGAVRAARAVLRDRAQALRVAAPPGLRTRIVALAAAETAAPARLGWAARLGAFAAAAALVVAIGGTALAVATPRWSVVLAAQLALDHLKCFTIDGEATLPALDAAAAEATITAQHGWSAEVPPGDEGLGLRLVAVRECLYADGFAAHVLYRLDGEPVSLFIVPGQVHPEAELRVLGEASRVWSAGDRTYVLMTAAGNQAGLDRVAAYVRNEAQ